MNHNSGSLWDLLKVFLVCVEVIFLKPNPIQATWKFAAKNTQKRTGYHSDTQTAPKKSELPSNFSEKNCANIIYLFFATLVHINCIESFPNFPLNILGKKTHLAFNSGKNKTQKHHGDRSIPGMEFVFFRRLKR